MPLLTLPLLSVAAQSREPATLLQTPMSALQDAGFAVAPGIRTPEVPIPKPTAIAPVDETSAALTTLASLAVKDPNNYPADFARAFGFEFSGDSLPMSVFSKQRGPDATRYFSTTSVSGKLDILIEEAWKVDGHTTLISCRVTPQGVIESATRTTKPNGQFQFENIPLPEGEASCRKILDFWTKYYLDNLKPTLK
jgi:hypothetical protein